MKAMKKPMDNKVKPSGLHNNNGRLEYTLRFEQEEAVKLVQLFYQN